MVVRSARHLGFFSSFRTSSRPFIGSYSGAEAAPLATSAVVLVTYWLSFEYVREPRKALEPESAAAAMGRGAFHALALLMPHLDEASREHLRGLAAAYVES